MKKTGVEKSSAVEIEGSKIESSQTGDNPFTLSSKENIKTSAGARGLVLHPAIRPEAGVPVRDAHVRLDEATGLARAIDLDIIHAEIVRTVPIRPSTYIGGGVIERMRNLIVDLHIDVVVIDTALSPAQQRNLEMGLECKVIDRTGLILEIFGSRARTHEGRLQVELAALGYQRSRLVKSWTHLERQRGGAGFMGGPGETQLEIDRRLIDERMGKLKRQLENVKRTRTIQRQSRKKVPWPVCALVGYTNAGKSTLFNTVTQAEVLAQDMLFATLDPTMREMKLPAGQRIILSDTVGFISDLPHELVASFRATLEEVCEADVILHVRDIASADSDHQRRDVQSVMAHMDVDTDIPVIEVWNKIDNLSPDDYTIVEKQANRRDDVILISAIEQQGLDTLLSHIESILSRHHMTTTLQLPASDGAVLAWIHSHSIVLDTTYDEDIAHITIKISPDDWNKFQGRFPQYR